MVINIAFYTYITIRKSSSFIKAQGHTHGLYCYTDIHLSSILYVNI
jgi:hypothetical protein